MSWISDLAGKAENILNKIDQNAANVLQQPARPENDKLDQSGEVKVEESIVEGLKKSLSSSSLTLTKSLTPKRLFKSDLNTRQSEEKANDSNLSSRRSSISSRKDGLTGDQGTAPSENSNYVDTKTNEFSTEKELTAMRIALAEITNERNELKIEISNIKEELKHAKGEEKIKELKILVSSLAAERDAVTEEINKLRESQSNYLKSISETDANLAKSRQNILELTEKLNWQIKETEQVTAELRDYRQKAKSTLQMKDKIIEKLKCKGKPSADPADNGNEKVLKMEVESVRHENLNLNEELSTLRSQLEKFKILIQELEGKLHEKQLEINNVRESFGSTRLIDQERCNQLESEVKILNQELHALREEANRQRQSLTAQLHEKERELLKLRRQASEMPGLGDPNSIENRIESLTQALVKKQTAIEGVTAERNALRIQLEKVEEQFRHLLVQNRQHRIEVIHMNDTDDAKAKLPLLMTENPFDTNVARRMKRAYSTLDSAGIRIGVFLRRYPLIRILVLIYVALLHLWVMFVLLSSTPT